MYTGPLYQIQVTGQPDLLEATEDHPILAVVRRSIKGGRRLEKGKGVLRWVKPAELKVGDYLAKARISEISPDDSWDVTIPMVLSRGIHPQWSEQIVSLPLTTDLGTLVGYYLAEGSVSHSSVAFSFHEREQNYRNDVRRIVHRSFGFEGHETRNTGRGRGVRFDSAILARVLGSLGRGCDKKRIPPTFMKAAPAVKAGLVKGLWRGDGHREFHGNYFGIVTTSPDLAYQTQEILASLGIAAGVTARSPRGKRRNYHILVTGEFSERMAKILDVRFTDSRNRTASKYVLDDEFVYAPIREIRVGLQYRGRG